MVLRQLDLIERAVIVAKDKDENGKMKAETQSRDRARQSCS